MACDADADTDGLINSIVERYTVRNADGACDREPMHMHIMHMHSDSRILDGILLAASFL